MLNSSYFFPEATLDYHDLGELTDYDIEQHLNIFLVESHAAGYDKVLIITGIGIHSVNGPKVRPLVTRLLAENKLIAQYKQASIENGGRGAFEIWLKDKIK
ncbi:Smr/MutS family protein [Candidatus Dojkabacteria bacterium]|uniref:Smr/MutS family protein n=1 Tax=Candidatus Dojkabacteria bacterium TaxID=2099670 RepID=A0A955L5X7_9BACT|nr:Smr/MutS family protein [Candidatus Dojkabacteria bacterium]